MRLWVKRDDLTGLGGGGNKARKLDVLCAEALADGVDAMVTVGAAQSNHCRMTAAAGARLGLDVHLVVSGEAPRDAVGNQLMSRLFGAQLHFTGAADDHWGELAIAAEQLVDDLRSDGVRTVSIPIGGSTPLGAASYATAFEEIEAQSEALGIAPSAIVTTSSSGGTHAGLLAGRALTVAGGRAAPDVIAIGVAQGVIAGRPDAGVLATEVLALLGAPTAATIDDRDVVVDGRFLGRGYAIPTEAGDAAIRWAARHGGWLLDRTYSGKGMSGLLALAAEGRFDSSTTSGDAHVVFVHTGGWPALFAPGGTPAFDDTATGSQAPS